MNFKTFVVVVCAIVVGVSGADERRKLQYGGGDYAEWVACNVNQDLSCCTRWPNLWFCPTSEPTPLPTTPPPTSPTTTVSPHLSPKTDPMDP